MNFEGKNVLITGASRGIGRACAIAFAEKGGSIAINYLNNLEAALATKEALKGDRHILAQGDVSDPLQVKAIVDQTVKELGSIDILVNNTGIHYDHEIDKVEYDEWIWNWRKTLDVNLIGAANTMFCAAQYMMKQNGGRIVNISSRGAFRGEPEYPAYGASKAGMNALGQSLAKKLAPYNIFIGTVAPGFTATDMAKPILEGPLGPGILEQSPLKRVAKPEEVAYAALFLASEGAAFMTGAIVDVNGASYLRT